MNKKRSSIAKEYLKYLEDGNTTDIVNLFAPNGIVNSPLYGNLLASDFYRSLNTDTRYSAITLYGIFEEAQTGNVALYFKYNWTLKSGKNVDFDVVDIIKFNQYDQILYLNIIYDTVLSRKLLNEIK